MKDQNKWEQFYKNTPLEEISWQGTQDDYLKEIIDSGMVSPGSALDLGCGTGIKSIFLTKNGFEVVGVDISETAIAYANENAEKSKVRIEFIAADATNLDFLEDKIFDFVLDWANLHGIPKDRQEQYISGIVEHTKIGSKLLLRCFGRNEDEPSFTNRPMGRISLFSRNDIKDLYGNNFKIIKENTSEPGNENAPGKFFHEFLMERV